MARMRNGTYQRISTVFDEKLVNLKSFPIGMLESIADVAREFQDGHGYIDDQFVSNSGGTGRAIYLFTGSEQAKRFRKKVKQKTNLPMETLELLSSGDFDRLKEEYQKRF